MAIARVSAGFIKVLCAVRFWKFLSVSMVAATTLIASSMVQAQVVVQSTTVETGMSRQLSTRPVTPAGPAVSLRRTIPLPAIVAGLQSQLPYRNMNYIGVERYDPQSGIYALRFLNRRQVIVVVVDGRSGRILDRGF
jgi:hypothetical protein